MSNQHNQRISKSQESVLADIGENYQYIKTIITHTAEIKKLELLQNVSHYINKAVIMLLLLFFGFMMSITLVALIIVVLANAMNSYTYALLATIALLIILSLTAYYSVKKIVRNKIELAILANLNQKP